MYLSQLKIKNFRKINNADIHFQKGLNVIVGANNVGKTAVIDALRALFAGHDEPYPRFDLEDIHCPQGGKPAGDILFEYIFSDLDHDDEADFIPALKPGEDKTLKAHITVRYTEADKTGRLRVKRWCGEHEDVGLTSDMMENLRGIYLQPLRDASQSLKPGRSSQLSRLLQLLTDEPGREGINEALKKLDEELKEHPPIIHTQVAISSRHDAMLGNELSQALEVGLSASDFQRMSARLSLLVDSFEIEQNGLGFNNLIFMAVVLSELTKNPEATYRCLIVEEPEAHLHPQLQSIFLNYLESIQTAEGEKPVQVFVTSHSPNFASIANLDCLTCLVDTGAVIETFFPRTVIFEKGKREKLERYLDVTRAELFFARRVIFVEGAAELLLVNVLAKKCGFNLREHGVSLISVEGLNFDSFLPLFGEKALKIPVALITDADPVGKEPEDGGEPLTVYPDLDEKIAVSDNTAKLKKLEDNLVKVYHGVKTFEYDMALHEKNRVVMIAALKEIHPKIAAVLEIEVNAANGNKEKARVLFRGMFERQYNNVQKGSFAQALSEKLESAEDFIVPTYITDAISHVCKKVEVP